MADRFHVARGVFTVAALAAALTLTAPADSEASLVVLQFECGEEQFNCHTFTQSDPTHIFEFGTYNFIVGFEQIIGAGFDLAVDSTEYLPVDFPDGRLPSGLDCVPIGGGVCVVFTVFTDAQPGVDYVSNPGPGPNQPGTGITVGVEWTANTNPTFPNPLLLHDSSDTPDDIFAENMTTIYCPDEGFTDDGGDAGDCQLDFFPEGFEAAVAFKALGPNDPAIGGETDNFFEFTVAGNNPIPEPGTLLLMTAGLGGAVYRRYRRPRA